MGIMNGSEANLQPMSQKAKDGTLSAVFMDRDGTLNVEKNYVYRVEDFEWIRGAVDAIRQLKQYGFKVFVVTNQAGVAYGYYSEDDVQHLHQYMQNTLVEVGTGIDAFYYCPYHQDAAVAAYRRASDCRKPATGMFDQAIRDWRVDPEHSFVVGDRNSDIEAGRRLGMTTLLVQTGHGLEAASSTRADYVETDVFAAARRILHITQKNSER